MSILSLFHLLFRLVALAYLHAWHTLVQTFRRIHIRSSRPHKPTQVRVVDLPQNLVIPLPSIRPPIPAVVNPLSSVDITPVRFPSESSKPQPKTKSLWSVTRFVNPGYFSSAGTFQTPDVELGHLDVYHLTPLPLSHPRPSVQPPLPASVTPFKPSLFVKASQLLTKSEPFSNDCASCLDGQITHRSPQVVECGGYSDIYEGRLRGHLIAIKVFRSFTSSSRKKLARSKLQRRVWREYLTWSSLSHPNILPCLGFTFDFAYDAPHQLPALVSPWMPNGTVLEYLHNNPSAKRLPLLWGITNGLYYLHSQSKPVIHGDIRCSNILVSSTGQPRLADFGLSRILNNALGLTTSSDVAGSLRWMSPEILDGNKTTSGSDVWAYGMTVLELLTQKRPYAYLTSDPAVLRHIICHMLPRRPSLECAPGVTDQIWQLCLDCWKIRPRERTTMGHALHIIKDAPP